MFVHYIVAAIITMVCMFFALTDTESVDIGCVSTGSVSTGYVDTGYVSTDSVDTGSVLELVIYIGTIITDFIVVIFTAYIWFLLAWSCSVLCSSIIWNVYCLIRYVCRFVDSTINTWFVLT